MKRTRYPNVYQDDNGSFFYQIFIGRDKHGRTKFKKSRTNSKGQPFTSAKSANNEAIKVKNNYLENSGKLLYRMTYKAYMEKKYIPKYKGDVERSTFLSHYKAFTYAIEHLGNKLLEDITVLDCEEYRTWLLTKSGFSKNYASMVYISFRQSLDYAVTVGILDVNVSMKTKSISKGKAIVAYWNKQQFEKVISQFCIADYHEYYCFMMIWFYFMTGVRVSEALALKWSDVDLKNKKVRIHHTLDYTNKSNYTIKPYTKTANGKRTISIDDDTVNFLKNWKNIQRKHGVRNFVISFDDTPTSRSTVNKIIKRYAKLAGVPKIEAKGLRHSHVSYLINEFNADVLTISRRLGHSGPDITLKHYSHLWNRNDSGLTKLMTGNVSVTFAPK